MVFVHDRIHCRLIFFEKRTKLLVFMEEGLIFDNKVGVRAFYLGIKEFYEFAQ